MARRRRGPDRGDVAYRTGSNRRGVRSESVDLVICSLALTHLNDMSGAVAEFARIVRPGGHVVLTDNHPVAAATGAHARSVDDDGRLHVVRNHVHWPSAYLASSASAGLEVEECREPEFHLAASDDFSRLVECAVGGLSGILAWKLRRPGPFPA